MLEAIVAALIPVVATSIVGGIYWGGKLNQRVQGLEKVKDERLDSIKELFETKFEFLDQRLGRIETALNGYMREPSHGRHR